MSRFIKLDADTSPLRKSILDLSKVVGKDLGKSKIELFTPDTKKFLRGEAIAGAEALKRQIDLIKDSTRRHQAALKDVVSGSKEELKIREKILNASRKIAEVEKDRARVKEMAESLQKPGFGKQFGKFSGFSTAMGGASGLADMGLAGGAGALAGMAGAAALAYGGSRVLAGRQTYLGGIDDRLKLRGRGVSDLEPENMNSAANVGLNALSLRQARLRDIDVYGREGASQANVIKRAGFERNYGVEEGTLSGYGAQFRSSMGAKGADQTTMKLQASLIASGITDAIGPYLETAAQMLTEINDKGFTHDEAITSLFNAMTKTGMGEGRAKQLMMGADQGIRGSSGEANAFFQSAFGKAGIGGGTIGGSQAAMRMGGLFGVDLNKYKGMSPTNRKVFETLGIGGAGHMHDVAGTTTQMLDQMFGSEDSLKKNLGSKNQGTRMGAANNQLARLRYVMRTFGLKDEGQAAEVEGLLKKASNSSPGERAKIMKQVEAMKDNTPELENLKKISASNDGIQNILQNMKTSISDNLGATTSEGFNKANELLNEIDKAITYIAQIAGFSPGGEKTNKEKFETHEFKAERMAREKQEAWNKIPGAAGTSTSDLVPGGMSTPPSMIPGVPDELKKLNKTMAQVAKNTGSTAKHVKEKGTLKPSSGNTAGN